MSSPIKPAAAPKQEKSKWTPAEESTLIDLVLSEEERLFGPLKGAASESVRKLRLSIWQKISDEMNSRFCNERRDVAAIKKKYSNIKQRAKEKLDLKRKDTKKTGGGPAAPSCTPAEDALLKVMHDRPFMVGFAGVDSNALGDCAATATEDVPIGTKQTACSVTQVEETVTPVEVASCSISQPTTIKKMKRKLTIREKIDIANLKNLELDNVRIEQELNNQKLTQERLKLEIEMLQNKKVHYQLRLQAEYGITLQTEE